MKRLLLILLLILAIPVLADIERVNTEVTLPYWPDYILSGDPNELDEYFKILVKTLQDLQDEIITTVNLGVDLDDTDIRYFGTKDGSGDYADGDWRIIKIGSDDFQIQKLVSATWTQMSKWSQTDGFEYLDELRDSSSSFLIDAGTISGAVDITGTGTITGAEIVDSSTSGTSTEWEDAYNKRVDTWTLPLLWSSNTASLSVASAEIIVGNSSGVGTAVAMSGDVSIDNTGATTIQPDSVALGTDTTGNYVQSITNGTSITGGDGGSEGAALTLDVGDDSIDGTELVDDITVDGSGLTIGDGGSSDYISVTSSGDTTWVGTSAGLQFGHMYVDDAQSIIVALTQDTPTEVEDDGTTSAEDGWLAGELNGVTFPSGGAEHYVTVNTAGRYEADWDLSFSMATPGGTVEIHGGVAVDGAVKRPAGEAHRTIANNTDTGNMGAITVINCPNGNEEISLWMENTTNSADATITHGNLYVKLIAGASSVAADQMIYENSDEMLFENGDTMEYE